MGFVSPAKACPELREPDEIHAEPAGGAPKTSGYERCVEALRLKSKDEKSESLRPVKRAMQKEPAKKEVKMEPEVESSKVEPAKEEPTEPEQVAPVKMEPETHAEPVQWLGASLLGSLCQGRKQLSGA